MSGTEAKAPEIQTEEALVSDDERIMLSETPELPPALETGLDRFVEALALEEPGPAEFILGSALAATAESFGPSEAENLLRSFDQELTAEFFENLIETGDIPQHPTMNNLLAGDVNSPAAQFILENLAAQCASGAFNTMQSTLRESSRYGASGSKNRNGLSTAAYIQSLSGTDLYNYYSPQMAAYSARYKPQFKQDAEGILEADTDDEKAEIWKRRYEEVLEDMNNDPQFDDLTQEQRNELAMMFTNKETMNALTEAIMERNPGMSREDAMAQAKEEMQLIWEKVKADPSLAPTIMSSLQSLTQQRDTLETLLASKEAERDQMKADLDTRITENRSEAEAISDPVERELALLALDSTACLTPQALADQIHDIMVKHGQVLPDGTQATPSEGSSNPLDFDPTINYPDVDNARVRELMAHYNEWFERDSEEMYQEWDINALQKQIDDLRTQIADLDKQIADLEAAGLADTTLASDIKDKRDVYANAEQQLADQLAELGQDSEQAAEDVADMQASFTSAKMDLTMATTDNMLDEMGLGSAITDHHSVTRDLRAEGFATIRLTKIGNEFFAADAARTRQPFDFDIKLTADANEGIDYLVQQDEEGHLFAQTADGQRIELDGGLQHFIQTAAAGGIAAARFDIEHADTSYFTSLQQTETARSEVVASDARVGEAQIRAEGILMEARLKSSELSALTDRRENIQHAIDIAKAEGRDVTALTTQLTAIDTNLTAANQGLANITTSFSSIFKPSEPALDTSLTLSSGLDLSLNTGSSLNLGSSGNFDLTGDSSTFNLTNSLYSDPLTSTDSIFSLDYNFDFGNYDFTDITYDDSFYTQLDLAETYLTDLDFSSIDTELNTVQADLEAELQSIKIDLLTEAGVPEELHEAFIKDMEYSLLTGSCAANTNIGEQLGTNGPLSSDGGLMGSFGANMFNDQSMEAFRLTYAAESFAFTPEGERYKEILQSLNDMKGVTTEQAIAAAAASTEDAPSPEGPTTANNDKLISDAQSYAATAMGTITPQDILDQFDIDSVDSPEYAKVVEAMQDVIATRNAGLAEPVATVASVEPDDEPEQTVDEELTIADASPSVVRDSTYAPLTLGG